MVGVTVLNDLFAELQRVFFPTVTLLCRTLYFSLKVTSGAGSKPVVRGRNP